MGGLGATLTALQATTLPGGSVKVVGHGRRLLTRHLDVEVTSSRGADVQQWHHQDAVEVGAGVYIVNFIDFEEFTTGVPVARLVFTGSEDDPDFRRTLARATRVEFGR